MLLYTIFHINYNKKMMQYLRYPRKIANFLVKNKEKIYLPAKRNMKIINKRMHFQLRSSFKIEG